MSRTLLALVRDLRLRRGRERRGLTLAEGIRLVEEAIESGIPIRHVLVSPALEATPRGRGLQAVLENPSFPMERVTDKVFESLAATEHPQGVLAVVEPRRWSLEDLSPGAHRPVLVLDAVQDPGNVGTMIRTAFGLGGAGVVALPGTAELTNPKVLRAGMGGTFRMPCVPADESAFRAWAGARRLRVMLAEAGAPLPARGSGPVALVVGNEGAGLRASLGEWVPEKVGVPLGPGAESLNVAIAAGILLYEVTRD